MEKDQNLQVTLLNRSAALLQKQSNSIIKWTETQAEHQLVKAINGGIAIATFNKDDDKHFLSFLGEWKIMIGDQRKTEGKGAVLNLIMIKDKIKQLYPTLTLPEIKHAVDLSLMGHLNISADLYSNQSFSILYCIGILKAFIDYKKEQLAPVFERWQKSAPEEKEVTEEELMNADFNAIKELFEEEYEVWLKTNEINDPFDQLYSYLQRTKKLKISADEVKKAKQYARDKIKEFLKKEDGSVSEAIEKMKSKTGQGDAINITHLEKKYAKKYCVYHLFKKLKNIKVFTDTISPEEFRKTAPNPKK